VIRITQKSAQIFAKFLPRQDKKQWIRFWGYLAILKLFFTINIVKQRFSLISHT